MPNNTIMPEDILRLKSTIPIQYYYASQLGQPVKSHGDKVTYFCPFHHDDKTPHFIVSSGGQYRGNYTCFYCDAKGDVINFHMLFNHLTFPEAYKTLNELYGLPDTKRGA